MHIKLQNTFSISCLIICFMHFSNSLYAQKFPLRIGQKYHGKIDSFLHYLLLTSGGSFDSCFYTTISNVQFGFSKSHDGNVKFIICDDKNFITDNVRIGDSYLYVKKQLKDTTIYNEWGFSRFVRLPSGWYACFPLPQENHINWQGHSRIEDSQKLIWFYKRH